MRIKQKLFFFISLIAVHLIVILPIIYLSILLIGKADIPIVLIFGVINALFAWRFFKGYAFFSILIGFLISSASLCLVYLISYIGLYFNPNFGIIFYIIVSVLIWIAIFQNDSKIKNQKNVYLITSLLLLIFLTLSFILKDIYPNKFENKDLISTELKIIDKQKMPKPGDSIKVRIYIQPLFGLKESHEIYKTTSNENGNARILLSKSRNYKLFIKTKENKFTDFEINSTDLKIKKLFIIEEE